MSIKEKCKLLDIPRSSYYLKPKSESNENLDLMRKLDQLYIKYPFYGSRRFAAHFNVNRKRIQRLMRLMDIKSIYPKRKTSIPNKDHEIYPYLLRNVEITFVNQVWSSDITYIPVNKGFFYLVAIMDWYSRFVIGWQVSNSLHSSFCIEVLEESLVIGTPGIFNTDQGAQYTSNEFIAILKTHEIQISMDGKGRYLDNIWIERLWRSLKYEEIYLNEYKNGKELYEALNKYFLFYNFQRPHQALNYKTPASIFATGKHN